MPESPEVCTVGDKLRPVLVTRVITNSWTGDRAKTVGFFNLHCPATIIGVRSHGKKLIIDLSTEHVIIVSLGMAGRMQFQSGNHSHVRFDISDVEVNGLFRVLKYAFSLYFDDHRYMGGVDIIPNPGIPLYFKDIGPDLLQLALKEETWIPLEIWLQIFTNKESKRHMYDVLLDQSLVAGIGWYLACEILYYSGIHPERRSNTLTSDEWDRVRICSHKVVALSYSYGGCTIKDFISPDGSYGMYKPVVYGQSHDPLGNVVIDKKISKTRTIHWVSEIQH